MKTAIKKKVVAKKNAKQPKKQKEVAAVIPEGVNENIDESLIEFSPFNRRRFYNQKALEELAADIKVHGVIHNITVRVKPDGRYELIIGNRRLGAARIAGLKSMPAKIVKIPDDLAKEIVFSENAHRENKHPLDEAAEIADMQTDKKSTKEIALRLGKSESFVCGRIKLLDLIEPFQEMFIADKMNIQEALQLATLSPDSQHEFFNDSCEEWQTNDDFELENLEWVLRRYKYDLTRAPFDLKDKKLLPQAGACSNCPFNTATLQTLFPEEAKEAICTNKTCYEKKCAAHYQTRLTKLFEEKPAAIILNTGISDSIRKAIEAIPQAEGLPVYDRYNAMTVKVPEPPDKNDYTDNAGEEESYFDEPAFNQAVEEYQTDMEEYNQMIESGRVTKGLFVSSTEAENVYFMNEKNHGTVATRQTAKAVQEAVKSGVATPELLQGEIVRLQDKEKRAKELDREKVQLRVHEQFKEHVSKLTNNRALTDADNIAMRLLAYQSLDYSGRTEVNSVLFIGNDITKEELYEVLKNLNEVQYSYLIRMAIASKSDSKYPNNITAYTLYKTAESACVNVAAIEEDQNKRATDREKVCNERIKDLEKRIEKLKKKAA